MTKYMVFYSYGFENKSFVCIVNRTKSFEASKESFGTVIDEIQKEAIIEFFEDVKNWPEERLTIELKNSKCFVEGEPCRFYNFNVTPIL